MQTKAKHQGAEFTRWMGPLLDSLRALGGSARPREASDRIAAALKLPEEQLNATTKTGQDRFYNQVAWARQYLVWEGLLDGSKRGVWTLTASGTQTSLSNEQSRALFLKWVQLHQEARRIAQDEGAQVGALSKSDKVIVPIPEDEVEEAQLLSVLRGLSPSGFERVCQRLLRESGFESVTVTGRSHDGGIDGVGVLQLNPFVRMKALFQCKRYKGTVSRAEVGDFRNAMLGRAEKGIFITTGRFSKEAVTEASRDGAPPIELVDGETLVELFERVGLGVKPRTVFDVDYSFFEQFRT
jgi:restriction system protein